MVNIDQVRLLEARVTKAIDYVNRITDENTLLKSKLDSYQKRIEELEVLIKRFKEDQSRIEEGIVSALNHLNRFEDDVAKTLTNKPARQPDGLPDAYLTDDELTGLPKTEADEAAGGGFAFASVQESGHPTEAALLGDDGVGAGVLPEDGHDGESYEELSAAYSSLDDESAGEPVMEEIALFEDSGEDAVSAAAVSGGSDGDAPNKEIDIF